MAGLLGRKLGMTQIFDDKGEVVPVTVVKAGPCTVVTKKLKEKEGYTAIQLGFEEVDAKKVTKPYAGHFLKKQQKVFKQVREVRTDHADSYNPGDVLTVSSFKIGDVVSAVGISKGKGFQGVIKRHHFAGGMASHGCSVSHRSAGSIGQRTYPGKVFKNKKMAGHLGAKRSTVRGLKIVGIEAEQNLLLIKGAVPGFNNGLVQIASLGNDFEKRFLEQKGKPQAGA